jgi:ferredoxin
MEPKFLNINKNKCTNCGLCVKSCITNSINIDDHTINEETCFGCFHCLAVCPGKAISYDGRITENLSKINIKEKDFNNMIYSRRTIRNFKDKEVSYEIINKFINLLKYSPTGTNSQKVHITVVNSKQKVKTVSDMVMRHFTFMSNLFMNFIFFPFLVLLLGYKRTRSLNKLKKRLKEYWDGKNILSYDAPCLFIFHSPKSSTPDMDCNIASTIGVFYAEVLGLSTCINGFFVYGINSNKRIKKYLGIPKNHKVYSTFLLGYAKYKYRRRVLREDIKVNII